MGRKNINAIQRGARPEYFQDLLEVSIPEVDNKMEFGELDIYYGSIPVEECWRKQD